jgi:hypothetical protein
MCILGNIIRGVVKGGGIYMERKGGRGILWEKNNSRKFIMEEKRC